MGIPTGTVTFLFTDVEGSTGLWDRQPAGMREALARHDEILASVFEPRSGYVFATGGDSFSVAFQSLDDGFDAAIAAQRLLRSEPWREVAIGVRMALHVGQAEERDGDYFGATVSRAARLLAFAAGGEIVVSESVASIVRDALPFGVSLSDLGEQDLKGLDRPERVFRVDAPGLGGLGRSDAPVAAAGTRFSADDRRRRSIAVLPFDVMGSDDDLLVIADGIVEDVITALSYWRHFPVTARNSTFTYRDSGKDIREIGAELDARFVLEGSVRRSGDTIRVTAQLIDASDGSHVWAGRYDGEVSAAFAFQDRISEEVARAIDPAVQAFEQRRIIGSATDPDAWDEFVRARALIESIHPEKVREGIRHAERAIELDPSNATAHALLAGGHFFTAWAGWTDDPTHHFEIADRLGRKAIEIDPDNAEGHSARGAVAIFRGDLEAARSHAERAIAANPSLWNPHTVLGTTRLYLGDPAGALRSMDRSIELAPFGYWAPQNYATGALAKYFLGDFAGAAEYAREAVARRTGYVLARVTLAVALVRLDRVEEAAEQVVEVERLLPGFGRHSFNQPMLPEQLDQIMEDLRAAGLDA